MDACLTELCAELRNYFEVPNGRHFGKFTISGGSIAPLDFLKEGQYFRVVGSIFNDGVYQYPYASLTDEEFDGSVWAMAVPPSFIALAEEIKQWCEKNKDISNSPFTSESYPNGYSYTVATGADGSAVKWQNVFSKQIAQWRKL